MAVDLSPRAGLYLELAEPAPRGQAPGQTNTTKAKETIDNEALLVDAFVLR
jgi:hypothetical protein